MRQAMNTAIISNPVSPHPVPLRFRSLRKYGVDLFSWFPPFFSGRTQNKVSLDSNTGRLALPDPLDYERDSNVYYLRIRAEEVGSRFSRRQSSEVNVQILLKDLNDNSPEFSQQRYRYSDKCFGYRKFISRSISVTNRFCCFAKLNRSMRKRMFVINSILNLIARKKNKKSPSQWDVWLR